jgi:uncharacterized protein with HEPN domain
MRRQLTVWGELQVGELQVGELGKHLRDCAREILQLRQIVSLRNRVIHGYDAVDDKTVYRHESS